MESVRKQLTLFLEEQAEAIEEIRGRFNPAQHALIAAHVTLCREDELLDLTRIRTNLQALAQMQPIEIDFGPVERFGEGKGVLLPALPGNLAFHALRKAALQGVVDAPRQHQPHITLLHPRNGTCTDAIFQQIASTALPTRIRFAVISLIEQQGEGKWMLRERFPLGGEIR
jgi:2'-5' RNA ligase